MKSQANFGSALRPLVITGGEDLLGGFCQWRLWGRLGWLEVRRRYSRTVIGPFWSAISLGMFVLALGSVGAGLWNRTAADYLPFLASGMVVWMMISTVVIESCSLFIAGNKLFREIQFSYSILIYALVWRNVIVFAHNVFVFLILLLLFGTQLISPAMLLLVPGMALVLINCLWVSLILGMLCLRFRDVQQLIASSRANCHVCHADILAP